MPPAALANLMAREADVVEALWKLYSDADGDAVAGVADGNPDLVTILDVGKSWQELDVVLAAAGISLDEANGTEYVWPPTPGRTEEPDWPYLNPIERRWWMPPTFLPVAAVSALAARVTAVDLEAVYDAIPPQYWETKHYVRADDWLRTGTLQACHQWRRFILAAARDGHVVASVFR
jgi:hypothetical protein